MSGYAARSIDQTASDTKARTLATPQASREREVALLLRLVSEPATVVAVHGIGGIGKSTLLETFAERARRDGAAVVVLDGHEIEPTERGFLHGLGACTVQHLRTPIEAARHLGSLARQVILIIDSCELLRLLDSWQRLVFIRLLPVNVRVVFAGRDPPVAAWLTDLGREARFHAVALGPLDDRAALEWLAVSGIEGARAHRIVRFTRGHPLALSLAAASLAAWHDDSTDPERFAIEQVMEELTRLYLADVHDPLTRMAVDAASVTRRATISLLRALLPPHAAEGAYERLHALPFVRLAQDGLYIHDLVRETLAAALRARDPIAYRTLKRKAWQQLRSEMAGADLASLWRYTADLLYLIENPVTREAFFPSSQVRFVFEPARPDDVPAIHRIVERHEGAPALGVFDEWWVCAARSFSVARAADGNVHGFCVMAEASQLPPDGLRADPVLEAWRRHLAQRPVAPGEQVLFLRRWLSRDDGEMPGALQAACCLDIKRAYVEMRPRLRRVYLSLRDFSNYRLLAKHLFYQLLPECEVLVAGTPYQTALLDFGPRSVDGWFARLASAELGLEDHELLDRDGRALVLQGERVGLTRLEFGAFQYLYERPGKSISREELIGAVWGYDYRGQSNLVDVVVRALRKKLGEKACSLQTVRGLGYRYRGEGES